MQQNTRRRSSGPHHASSSSEAIASSARHSLRLAPVALTLQALCIGAVAVGGFALPKQAFAQTAAATKEFNIPAGPLEATLNRLGRDAGVLITFGSGVTEGLNSPGVRGSYAAEDALSQVLKGTGLGAIRAAGSGYALQTLPTAAAASTSSATLSEIRVTAQAETESAWGRATGYVAQRGSTATKTDAPILEVAQSISVITRDRMDDQGVRTLNDALQYSAGVRSNTGGANPADDSMSVRGFSQFSGNFYQDGLRLMPLGTFGFYGVEPFGAERVEVLKGPASVLYGQNSPGGVVNFVSKRPTRDPVREIELSAGSFGRKQAAFDVGGALREDGTLMYRLVGLARDADQQIDYMRDDRVYLAPSVTWAPSARTSVTLRGFYQKNRAMQSTNIQYAALDGSNPNGRVPLSRFLGEPGFDFEETQVASLGYEARHELDSGWIVKQNFRYLHAKNHEQYMFRYGRLIDDVITNREIDSRDAKGQVYTLDTNLSGRFTTGSVRHELITGVDYNRSKTQFRSYIADGLQLNVFAPVYGAAVDLTQLQPDALRDEDSQQLGLYVQDRIQYDRWVLAVGGRHDWNKLAQTNFLPSLSVATRRNPSAFTGRAGLTYLADNGVAPYVSYTESFLPVSGVDSAARPFEPETGKQFEVGVKYMPNPSNSLTLAAFDLRRQNVLTTDPDDLRYFIQRGEVRSRGIELEGLTQPTKQVKLLAALTYNPTKVTKANPDAYGGSTQGKSLYETPKKMASVWAHYTFLGDLSGLGVGVGARYIGKTWGDSNNTFRVPAFTLVDASLRYDLGQANSEWKGVTVSVTAKNLLDKYHVASCFSPNACNYGEKRNVIVRVGYTW